MRKLRIKDLNQNVEMKNVEMSRIKGKYAAKQILVKFFIICLMIFGGFAIAQASLLIQCAGQIWDVTNNVALSDDINLIYDTIQDITWLDYTENLGMPEWSDLNDRAENLAVNVNGTIFDSWRLPATDTFENDISELDPLGSELGHLYHIGLDGVEPKYGDNVGPFSEIGYRDATALNRDIGILGDGWDHYYAFEFRAGEHVEWRSSEDAYWIPVHDGQVCQSVPEPPVWGAAPAQASVYGSTTSNENSKTANHLAFLLIPMGVAILLKRYRQKK